MEKATMTVEEMRLFMGIGKRQAYNLANSRDFPSFRMGRKILINRERLAEWMKEREGEK